MQVEATTDPPASTNADTVAIGLFTGKGVAHDVSGGDLQALVDSGEAKRAHRKLALIHAEGRRYILAGLGARGEFDPERARVAAAAVLARARELGTKRLCWELPHHLSDTHAAALVEGSVMGAYEFRAFKSAGEDEDAGLEELIVSAHDDVAAPVETGRVVGESVNLARDLQNRPANDLTPTALAERAREIAGRHDALSVEVMDRAAIEAAGMGAFAGVAKGTQEEPQLITLRYEPPGASGPLLGFVGKAVTFDSGGISIKPAAAMHEMKMDMSGGAAVLEATAAIAELGFPVEVISVIAAVENMPSGTATRPGDIITQLNGKTVEVNNTDAEGRLILADALTWCVRQGAERIVDLATLTGAVIVALGSTYAGLMSNDDEWAGEVAAAGEVVGELAWRLPLHPEYKELTRGTVADLANVAAKRKAGTIYAASFLEEFVEDATWAHLDIAGTSWDVGREYVGSGATGFGVRLLVELARSQGSGR